MKVKKGIVTGFPKQLPLEVLSLHLLSRWYQPFLMEVEAEVEGEEKCILVSVGEWPDNVLRYLVGTLG